MSHWGLTWATTSYEYPAPAQVSPNHKSHECSLYNDHSGGARPRKGGPELQTTPTHTPASQVRKWPRRVAGRSLSSEPLETGSGQRWPLVLSGTLWAQYIPTSCFPSPQNSVTNLRRPDPTHNVPGNVSDQGHLYKKKLAGTLVLA